MNWLFLSEHFSYYENTKDTANKKKNNELKSFLQFSLLFWKFSCVLSGLQTNLKKLLIN